MKTKQKSKKPTLKKLAEEVSMLRSFIIGAAGQDQEGSYRPDFVEDMLHVSASEAPRREFINAREFLRRIQHPA